MTDDDEQRRAGEDGQERPAVEGKRERLHQHDDADRDDGGRQTFPRTSAEAEEADEEVLALHRDGGFGDAHLRTAPKVMPRRRCFRRTMVKTRIGIRNRVVPAATAGQSWPPSPMMKGMNGG